jgi:hypothetical protein
MLRIIIFDLNVKVKLKVLESKKRKMKSCFKALIRIFIVIFSTRWRKKTKSKLESWVQESENGSKDK